MDEQLFSTPHAQKIIDEALAEDIGKGDFSSLASIPSTTLGVGFVKFKQQGIIAGIELAKQIFLTVDSSIKIVNYKSDGDTAFVGDIVMEAKGPVQSLLKSERVMLNFMQRLSGIATITNEACDIAAPFGCKVLDTRKTTPGLRSFEKWAVKIGGGHNHRFGLYDMIMLKDNHVDCAGGIAEAINQTNAFLKKENLDLKIEVETRTMEEVEQVLQTGGVHRIMLDNFEPEMLKKAVSLIDNQYETEASGGIVLSNLAEYAATGVQYVSLGLLTHSVKSLDINFKVKVLN